MKTNYHTHTTRCMHAVGSDEEYVLSAIKGGFQILGFSDHTPWKYRTSYVADMRMLPEELPEYIESLQYLREKYREQVDIKIGLECEYFPEYIPWLKEQIKKYQLNYILFGNHHFHTDEKFPYFGHHTDNRDMLDLYEESAIEGMESGLYNCLAHPDLFMRSYPKFDHHCATISRHICRTAARLNIPLEYNIGYVAYNEEHGLNTYPCPNFWHIAANEGCTAIIGMDAHNNNDLEVPIYYERALQELKELKIKTENGKEDAYHTQTKQTEQSERDVLRKMFFTYHILLLSFARRYSFYREVYQQADKKQYDSQEEQCLVMRATRRRFAQFGGNCGGNRAQRFQNAMGNYGSVSRHHQHRHRFADSTADAQDNPGRNT